MPCSITCSSWPFITSLFSNSFTPISSTITHHQFKLLQLNFPSVMSYSSYPFELLSFNSTHINLKSLFKPQFCSQKAGLSFQEVKEERKSRAEHFVEEIRATPVENRPEFVDNVGKKHVGSKTVAYFNDLIKGLVGADELGLALQLFDEMPLRGIQPDEWTYSIVIRCFCKKNEPDEGKRVLDLMIEKGFRPNVVTLSILVQSFCSRGRVQKGLEVLEMMDRSGCKPSVQTYNIVMKALCFVGRVEEAYEMLMGLKSNGNNEEGDVNYKPDIYSYTAVMDGLCKVGRSEEAMELLGEAIAMGLTPNVVAYNCFFTGYWKEGKPMKGIRLLKQMKESGCSPDYISYSTLLHGLLKWGKTMAAFSVYKEMMEVGFKVDERMMNTMLRSFCRKSWREERLLETVYEVVDQMKSWDYAIYPDTYYLVIQTYCVGKEVDKALVNLYSMVAAGYFPRMFTINRIIRGLCEDGRIGEALSILVLVFEASRIPSKISFNILIDELNRRGNLVDASSVYGAALKLGVIPHKKPLCIP